MYILSIKNVCNMIICIYPQSLPGILYVGVASETFVRSVYEFWDLNGERVTVLNSKHLSHMEWMEFLGLKRKRRMDEPTWTLFGVRFAPETKKALKNTPSCKDVGHFEYKSMHSEYLIV